MSDLTKNKEVRFDLYSSKCKHAKVVEWESPCNECLEQPVNEGTQKPVNFKEKE